MFIIVAGLSRLYFDESDSPAYQHCQVTETYNSIPSIEKLSGGLSKKQNMRSNEDIHFTP